jgi:beta-lactamase regulating signal transducer with metallopeptidase domain
VRRCLPLALLIVGISMVSAYLLASGDAECRWGMSAEACAEGFVGQLDELLETIAALSVAVGLFVALMTLLEMRRHGRLVRQLETTARTTRIGEHEVHLVPGLDVPYVAGLLQARIYCPADLEARLSPVEVRAVVLHERHHQRTHAPLRLIVLSAFRPVVEFLPGGHAWVERRRGAMEIAADDHAIAMGARRSTIAGALLKLSVPGGEMALAGYASASELRLRHLLGDEEVRETATSKLALLAVSLLGIAPCLLRGISV